MIRKKGLVKKALIGVQVTMPDICLLCHREVGPFFPIGNDHQQNGNSLFIALALIELLVERWGLLKVCLKLTGKKMVPKL